jgi:hypothetical protein
MTALLICTFSTSANAKQTDGNLALTPEQLAVIHGLVGNFDGEFSKKNCPRSQCRILVADFTLASGESCQSCRTLSDAVAKGLERLGDIVDVVGRDSIRSFLEKERIPSTNFTEGSALEWLGRHFGATHVLSGSVELRDTELQLIARFQRLEISQKNRSKSKESLISLSTESLVDGLEPSEAFPPQLKEPLKWDGHEVIRYDKSDPRMTSARCTDMPAPPSTPEASKAKVGGTLQMEAVVTVLGSRAGARIVSGLPYGLNDQALKTLKTWRCKPGTLDGVPVSMLVPFEDTFRFY